MPQSLEHNHNKLGIGNIFQVNPNEAIYQTADKASSSRRSEIEMNPIFAADDASGAEIEMNNHLK